MTNFEVTDSVNYAAECIEAPAWEDMIQFPTLQNLRGIPWAGYTILVPRDYAGARLVVFPAESQLSETVAHDLNLYAKAELNADTTLSGYLACNRRIKAIRLRGVPSNALALPAEYFGSPAVGEVFDTVDGVPVSRKYVVPQKASNGTSGKRVERLWRRVEDKMLPMHYDTGQYWRKSDKFADDDMLIVTQKLHGCFPASTKVLMWGGSSKKIYHVKKGDVLVGFSENGEAIQSVAKRDAFATGLTDSWYRLKFRQPRKGDMPTLTCTPDHQILTRSGYVAAQDMKIGDVATYTRYEPFMTYQKEQVLTGLMLGDGSIAGKKRNSVEWSHKADHEEYVDYVSSLLGNIGGLGKKSYRVSGYGTPMIANRTQALSCVRDVTEKWENGIPDNLQLTETSLAIWYMDDGSLSHSELQADRANFAVCAFHDEDIKVLDGALAAYGFTNYTFYKSGNGKGDRAYWRLRLNKEDADMLFKDIRHLIPPTMQYKLPTYHRGYFVSPVVHDELGPRTYDTELLSIEESNTDIHRFGRTKWDIETSTSNFAAQKIAVHNSSVRIANTIVKRKLSWLERLLQRIGVRVQDTEFDVIGGSRKVIKDPTNLNQQHWYGSQDGGFNGDIWTHAAQRFGSVIPKNVILYGELVGWLPDTNTPIQNGYTYRIPVGVYELFVYRVAVVTEDGGLYDLSWDGVREFCAARGLNHVPELWRGRKSEFDPTHWTDQRFAEAASAARLTGVELFRDIPLPLADESPVDEGVVTLREGVVPFALKVKGPRFYEFESQDLDKEEE